MKSLVFHRNENLFFDDLILLFTTDISIAIAIDSYKHVGEGEIFKETDYFDYEGSPLVSDCTLRFYPYNMMLALSNNRSPADIEMHIVEQSFSIGGDGYKVSSTYELHSGAVQACFTRYFKKSKVLIEKIYGTNVYAWPETASFGRVVRSAFAHGVKIYFRNPNAKCVSWRGLTYNPSMNGKQILYNDLNAVEVILLMADIDKFLDH